MNFYNRLFFNVSHRRQKIKSFSCRVLLSTFFTLLITLQVFAQSTTKTVSGTVRDEQGLALSGVSVNFEGTTKWGYYRYKRLLFYKG